MVYAVTVYIGHNINSLVIGYLMCSGEGKGGGSTVVGTGASIDP